MCTYIIYVRKHGAGSFHLCTQSCTMWYLYHLCQKAWGGVLPSLYSELYYVVPISSMSESMGRGPSIFVLRVVLCGTYIIYVRKHGAGSFHLCTQSCTMWYLYHLCQKTWGGVLPSLYSELYYVVPISSMSESMGRGPSIFVLRVVLCGTYIIYVRKHGAGSFHLCTQSCTMCTYIIYVRKHGAGSFHLCTQSCTMWYLYHLCQKTWGGVLPSLCSELYYVYLYHLCQKTWGGVLPSLYSELYYVYLYHLCQKTWGGVLPSLCSELYYVYLYHLCQKTWGGVLPSLYSELYYVYLYHLCQKTWVWTSQGFIQRGGGRGGFIPLMILARGGYPPPPSNCRTVFFLMGILVKSFKKVFRRQIPFFSKFVFSNCPPHKFFSGGNPASEWQCIR